MLGWRVHFQVRARQLAALSDCQESLARAIVVPKYFGEGWACNSTLFSPAKTSHHNL